MKNLQQVAQQSRIDGSQKIAIEFIESQLKEQELDSLYYTLAILSADIGDFQKSIDYFDFALTINPEHKDSLYDRGAVLFAIGQWEEAIATANYLVTLDENYRNVLVRLGGAYSHLGDNKKAVECYTRAIELNEGNLEAWSDLFLCLNYVENTPEELYSYYQKFSEILKDKITLNPTYHNNSKIRIGYVSSDLRNHAMGYLLKGLITNHNKENFDVYYYHNSPIEDDITDIFKNSGNYINSHNLTNEELYSRIKEDSIDVLIDLNGHTQGNRLPIFIWGASPIQISWFGFLNTTGIPAMTHRFLERDLASDEIKSHYTEQLIELTQSFHYSPPQNCPDVTEAPCKSNGFVTYGIFNNIKKVNIECLRAWVEILKKRENSRLLLIGSESDAINKNIMAFFNENGITNVTIKKQTTDIHSFMETISQVDVALDSFPHVGGTTTAHTLWMGVPVITLRGNWEYERISSSLVKSVDLDECIATSIEEYIQKSIDVSEEYIQEKRMNLRSKFPNYAPILEDIEGDIIRIYREMNNGVLKT